MMLGLLSASADASRWRQADLTALAGVARAASEEGLFEEYSPASLEVAPSDEADARADAAALRVARDFFEGSARVRGDKSWHIARGTLDYRAWLDDVLARHSVRSSFRVLLPVLPAYAGLKQGLARCRTAGGDCTTIAVNMDRLRALPRDTGRRYLWVDVPAFRLDLVEDGRVIASHRIIVGKPGTQTPSFQADVTGVTVNPWWNVPCSIVEESIGKLIADNPAEATRRGYVASHDAKGALVVRQKPGPNNALGQIKLEMPNPYGVYIHDTPSRSLFASQGRALSHGCIRTEDPKSLALILLGEDKATIVELLLATGASRTLRLPAAVPVYIVYITAEPDPASPNGITLYPDIYGRDRR